MPKKLTNKQFIEKANKIHNNKYEYLGEYVNSETKIKIICQIHGVFFQTPHGHLSGKGCKQCGNQINSEKNTLKFSEFVKKANRIHNNTYTYVDYINYVTPIPIICSIHGEFLQTPKMHFSGQGCKKCGFIKTKNALTKNFKTFESEANEVHNNKYTYFDEYVNAHSKIKIICQIHGEFYQRPHDHVSRRPTRCPQCAKSNYSQKAISWLNKIAKKENIYIQHAENKGEYSIPLTKYKADGYCEKTNTIYEFYGDKFHGNLKLFNENEQCHPFSDECAGSLYIKTMQREQIIKDLGYNLITIWEREYKGGC